MAVKRLASQTNPAACRVGKFLASSVSRRSCADCAFTCGLLVAGQYRVSVNAILQPSDEGDRIAAQSDHPAPQLDHIQPSVAKFALADIGLQLAKRFSQLHLRNTC